MPVVKLGEPEEGEFKEFPTVAAGPHEVEVAKVTVKPQGGWWIDEDDHSKGKHDAYNFQFKILEGEFAGLMVFGTTPTTFKRHELCKLYSWVLALMNTQDLPADFELDLDNLVGMRAIAVVAHKPKKDAKDPTKDVWVNVKTLKPIDLEEEVF